MKSRKERREEARLNKTAFEPVYNKGRLITKAEYDKEVLELKEKRKKKVDKLKNKNKESQDESL